MLFIISCCILAMRQLAALIEAYIDSHLNTMACKFARQTFFIILKVLIYFSIIISFLIMQIPD